MMQFSFYLVISEVEKGTDLGRRKVFKDITFNFFIRLVIVDR